MWVSSEKWHSCAVIIIIIIIRSINCVGILWGVCFVISSWCVESFNLSTVNSLVQFSKKKPIRNPQGCISVFVVYVREGCNIFFFVILYMSFLNCTQHANSIQKNKPVTACLRHTASNSLRRYNRHNFPWNIAPHLTFGLSSEKIINFSSLQQLATAYDI